VTLARKPTGGTLVDAALRLGTGPLNIDGTRVGSTGGTAKGSKPVGIGHGVYGSGLHGTCDIVPLNAGRWPANVILDHQLTSALDFQSGASKSPPIGSVARTKAHDGFEGKSFAIRARVSPNGHGDQGGASRFFKQVDLTSC
jgi:hypothetical protein